MGAAVLGTVVWAFGGFLYRTLTSLPFAVAILTLLLLATAFPAAAEVAVPRLTGPVVDPAGAIQQVKIKSTVDWYMEHLMPWRKK